MKVYQTTPIEQITIENLPSGKKRILLRENITTAFHQEEGQTQIVYFADEYSFVSNKNYTINYIEDNFEDLVYFAKNGATRAEKYAQLVNKFVREKYSQADVEAIINNYLSDNTNAEYVLEFNDLQAYRVECKERAMLNL